MKRSQKGGGKIHGNVLHVNGYTFTSIILITPKIEKASQMNFFLHRYLELYHVPVILAGSVSSKHFIC